MNADNTIVHGLWIGDALSPMEQLCIRSYLRQGHQFHLWVYNPVNQVPPGTVLRDARSIVPESEVFCYTRKNKFGHGLGSYAGFSDIFRYRLLFLHGGWWTDMDVTCLQALDFPEPYVFRNNGTRGIVGNLMKCPAQSALMEYCYSRSVREMGPENTNWMLPIMILNDGIRQYGLSAYTKNFTNEDSWPAVSDLLVNNTPLPASYRAIHWMNEEWRRHGLDKVRFVRDSRVESLLAAFGIEHEVLSEPEARQKKRKLSKWYYRYIMLRSRTAWLLQRIQDMTRRR